MFKTRRITTLLATGIVALGIGAGAAQAKNGADDPAGHQRHSQTEPGDDHGRTAEPGDDRGRKGERCDHHGRKVKAKSDHRRTGRASEPRHGNDDGPGHR